MIRNEILKLKEIGRMPTESDADDNDEKIDELIEQYDELISSIEKPINFEEAEVLVSLFPDGFFYDMQWGLLHLFEACILSVSQEQYQKLIDQCPSKEWKENLQIRFENWKKKNAQ
ncbi:MAG: hypothetical protein Q4C98_06055 [Capnocytophaga sp.]|nr:hypothetical protein [Capnocytophaga sp.]